MGKKELQLKINELTQEIDEIKKQDSVNQETWYSTLQYALQQKIYADGVIARYGTDDDKKAISKNVLDPKIKKFWRYELIHENKFSQSYWFEANRFADWICAYIPIKATKYEYYDMFEMFKRNGFLWDKPCLVKTKEGKWLLGREASRDGTKIKITLEKLNINNVEIVNQNINWDKLKVEQEEYELGVNAFTLNLFWDNIGFYVKAIPYLATYIYFWRQLQKNVSFCNIVPIMNINNDLQKAQLQRFLTDCDIFEIDVYVDPQVKKDNKQFDTLFDRLKWYAPERTLDFYNTLLLNLDKHWELLCNAFGRPMTNASGEQRLNADANIFAANSEFIMKNFFDRFLIVCKELKKAGFELEIKENKMEERLEEVKPKDNGGEGKQNAAKDNPKDSEHNKVKEGKI